MVYVSKPYLDTFYVIFFRPRAMSNYFIICVYDLLSFRNTRARPIGVYRQDLCVLAWGSGELFLCSFRIPFCTYTLAVALPGSHHSHHDQGHARERPPGCTVIDRAG